MNENYDIVVIFVIIDEIVKKLKNENFLPTSQQGRKSKLTISELVTISVIGHLEQIQSLKRLHRLINSNEFKSYFNDAPCYAQFASAMRKISYLLDHVMSFFAQFNEAMDEKISIIDSTSLPITKYPFKYIKWANNTSSLSKSLDEWYQGYKLHLVINTKMEIIGQHITTASVHDVKMLDSDKIIKGIKGDLIGDKGYISEPKKQKLATNDINLITPLRENMDQSKNIYTSEHKRIRKLIETANGKLKDHFCLLYRFARNIDGFFSWVKSTVLAYSFSILFENEAKLDKLIKSLCYQF
jgi:hypothetical protein